MTVLTEFGLQLMKMAVEADLILVIALCPECPSRTRLQGEVKGSMIGFRGVDGFIDRHPESDRRKEGGGADRADVELVEELVEYPEHGAAAVRVCFRTADTGEAGPAGEEDAPTEPGPAESDSGVTAGAPTES